MFEDTIRALKNKTVSVPISDDEEGYFDRECPSEECMFQFKIFREDWKEKVSDEEVFCPFCRHSADSGAWWTQEQLEYAKQVAIAEVNSTLGSTMKRDAARWNRRQSRNSFISMTMKVNNRPQRVSLPSAVAEPMQLKITCSVCSCRYAVIGAAYFCPACGHNSADQIFALTIAGIRKSIDALDAVRVAISDRDTAENTVRLIIENGLQNAVTAFQRCAEALFASIPSPPKPRRNVFQNITEGSQLWQKAAGTVYTNYLTDKELKRLSRTFQQRHLLAHTQGMVDENYITKSNDSRYQLGQRIVIKTDTVLDAIDLIEKLIAGLKTDIGRLQCPE